MFDDDDINREMRNTFVRTKVLLCRFDCFVAVKRMLFKSSFMSVYDSVLCTLILRAVVRNFVQMLKCFWRGFSRRHNVMHDMDLNLIHGPCCVK